MFHVPVNNHWTYLVKHTVKPLLRGNPVERPTLLERPYGNVNLGIIVLNSTPNSGGLTRGVPLTLPISYLFICFITTRVIYYKICQVIATNESTHQITEHLLFSIAYQCSEFKNIHLCCDNQVVLMWWYGVKMQCDDDEGIYDLLCCYIEIFLSLQWIHFHLWKFMLWPVTLEWKPSERPCNYRASCTLQLNTPSNSCTKYKKIQTLVSKIIIDRGLTELWHTSPNMFLTWKTLFHSMFIICDDGKHIFNLNRDFLYHNDYTVIDFMSLW